MLLVVHRVFEYLAPIVGASPDELKLVGSFILSYPLAAVLKRLPDNSPEIKNAFIVGTSVFYLVGLFDLWDGLQTLLVSAAGTYLIASYMRTSPLMPWLGFLFLMGHLSASHLLRQFADSSATVDITGAQMVLVMKLNAFCWNVADGQLPTSQLSPLQQDRMLPELPNVLDYAGYVLFFPSLFAGPSFDYAEYRRWIDTTMFQVPSQVEPSKRPPVRKKRKIPRSGTPAARKAVTGLFWIGGFIYLSKWYPSAHLTSPEFSSRSFIGRVVALYMVGLTARLKYYGVWTLTEGACILTGLGYNGVDLKTGNVSWNRLQNIDPLGVEFAQNPRGYLACWNMNTNSWLRNYVYLRVTPKGKKPGFRATLLTFTTSALWHGFHPGYYLTFVFASFVQTVAKNYRRYLRPFFLDPVTGQGTSMKVYYDVVTVVVTQLTFAFIMAPFLMLSLSSSLHVWGEMYFYPVVVTALSMAFFSSPGKKFLREKLEQRQGNVAGKLTRSTSQESLSSKEPVYGVSADAERDISEMLDEFKSDMKKMEAKKAGVESRESQ